MKKILFGLSVILAASVSAQNYPDYYPDNNYGNNGKYDDNDDRYYFPEDYYYEYPSDYYTDDFYRSSYEDYRRSIYDVDWNRFFAAYRLSPRQIRQIMMLNDRFLSFAEWDLYYRMNPDRWYYDRFFALQQILGQRIYIVYQTNFYNGYNPVVYYQNYRRKHYVPAICVLPKYRNVNINIYKIDRQRFHQNNPRTNIGFRQTSGTRNDSFVPRNNNVKIQDGNTRNNSFRPETNVRQNNTIRNNTPEIRTNNNSGIRQNQKSESRTPANSERNSGQRFTSR